MDKFAKILHWRAERDLVAMCRDAWNWQVRNPNGSDNHCKKDTFIFVELKGSKINHAFVQLENTIKSLVLDIIFHDWRCNTQIGRKSVSKYDV